MFIIKRGNNYLRIINGIYPLWTTDKEKATKLTLDEISHIKSRTLFEIKFCEN